MAIIAKATETYTPAPEGVHQAICCDVIDLGSQENKFKPGTYQHKIKIVLQLDVLKDDGKRFLISQFFTLSLNEKSNLRPFLETWRGKKFTADELNEFDVEKIIGSNCNAQILHAESNGKTYANIASVMPLSKGQPRIEVLDYTRQTPEQTAAYLAQKQAAPQQQYAAASNFQNPSTPNAPNVQPAAVNQPTHNPAPVGKDMTPENNPNWSGLNGGEAPPF